MSHCIIVHQNPLTWHSIASGQGKQNIRKTLYNNCTFIGFLCLVSCEPCLHGLVCLLYVNVIFQCKWIHNTWEVWRVSFDEVINLLGPLLTRKVSHDDKLIRSVWIQKQPIRRPDVSATDQSEAPTHHCYQGVTLRWSLNVIITKLGWESLEYFSRYRDTCHYRPQHHLTTLKIRWHAESAQDWICLESWNTQNLNI